MDNVVYGRNSVLELLGSDPEKIEKIYMQFNTGHFKLKEILITARRSKIPLGKARLEKLSEIAGTTKHQGVCALISSVRYYQLEEILQHPRNTSPLLVVLPGLNDPHNVGAIIRTAEAVAADGVILVEGKGSPVNSRCFVKRGFRSSRRICTQRKIIRRLISGFLLLSLWEPKKKGSVL